MIGKKFLLIAAAAISLPTVAWAAPKAARDIVVIPTGFSAPRISANHAGSEDVDPGGWVGCHPSVNDVVLRTKTGMRRNNHRPVEPERQTEDIRSPYWKRLRASTNGDAGPSLTDTGEA
ncbi:MAG: hypothetical protein B7X48_09890 [Acidiphilium sp. 34-60-192]|nr:MAG: hypothetical protein B7X48_09890 [Acidiphilium sp. 34-60-192]